MEFEFDPAKSEANLAKHGIDFEAAKWLWTDPAAYQQGPFVRGEKRWLMTARTDQKLWTAVFTFRAGTIRIISVRRARRSERREYERPERKGGNDNQS